MDFFNKLREPIVLKEDSSSTKQLEQLNKCLENAPENVKKQIEQDKRLLSYGIKGEEAIMFELKNSHMPMYILHDVFFTDGDLKTQIDYIVITRKLVLIIESKNLYGNITIDNLGNFTRTVQMGNHYKKEGIYSPITQNQRHLDMIREKRRASKGFLERIGFDKSFDENYKSIVVIANPKSVIDMKYAPKELKAKIVKVDGLNSYIKKLNDESTNTPMSDKQMKAVAEFFLENSVPNTMDYTTKYRVSKQQSVTPSVATSVATSAEPSVAPSTNASVNATPIHTLVSEIISEVITDTISKKQEASIENLKESNIEDLPVYKALKDYRYQQSQKEKVKAYYIFNNAQLEAIIRANPQSLDALKNIKGFGDVKCAKYGNDILKILKDF